MEAHTDFFKMPGDAGYDRQGGQRIFTGLLYLNAGFQGGETDFPLLGIKVPAMLLTLTLTLILSMMQVQPRRGMMLLWRNLDEALRPDNRTVHQGLPVLSGTKLAANMWVLERPFQGRGSEAQHHTYAGS